MARRHLALTGSTLRPRQFASYGVTKPSRWERRLEALLDPRTGGDHVLTDGAALALAIVIWSALILTVVAFEWLRRKEAQDLHLRCGP